MGDKILVEFDRKELDEMCATHCQWYKLCNQTNKDIIKCALRYSITFKIKEKNNGNKGTED